MLLVMVLTLVVAAQIGVMVLVVIINILKQEERLHAAHQTHEISPLDPKRKLNIVTKTSKRE